MLEFKKLGKAEGHLAWGYDVEVPKENLYLGRMLNTNGQWRFIMPGDVNIGSKASELMEIARFMNSLELDAVRARRKNVRKGK